MTTPHGLDLKTPASHAQQPGYPTMNSLKFAAAFLDELLLYSGQYALFYIIMNLSEDRWNYFSNFGHTVLLAVLLVQSLFLVRKGAHPVWRFMGSLIAPCVIPLLSLKKAFSSR